MVSCEGSTVSAFPTEILTEQQEEVARLLVPFQELPFRPRRDAYMPKREFLAQLLAGNVSEEAALRLECWFDWSSNIPDALEWLAALWLEALKEVKGRGDMTVEGRLASLNTLHGEAYAAYGAANGEWSKINLNGGPYDPWGYEYFPATMEAAKRYWVYRLTVESLLFEVWPNLNRDLLLKPDFGWLKSE